MKCSVSVELNDFKLFTKCVYKVAMAKTASSPKMGNLGNLIAFAVTAFAVFYLIRKFASNDAVVNWLASFLIAFPFMLLCLLVIFYIVKVQNATMPKEPGVILGEREYEISEEGFYHRTEHTEHFVKWPGIKAVEEYEGIYAVFIDTVAAFIIPKRAFSSSDEELTFISELKRFVGHDA